MITAEHVSKWYGARAAVSDLTFRIETGEVVGLLGRNGAGKTTTLKILSGLLVPTTGHVQVDGIDMREQPDALRSRIGFLPETPPLYPEMSVEELLRFVARIKGVRAGLDEAVGRALAATDLGEVRRQAVGTLSQGFQRRVGIAQAIVHRPALVLLDEPTSSLDPVQVVHMRKLVRALAREHTVIVSSHILAEIHQVCDRLLVLDKGRIVAGGTEAALGQKLSAVTSLEVEVRGSASALGGVLASLAGVREHVVEGEHDGITRARIELVEDGREELARAIVAGGLGLRRLERRRLELEDIFLSLTADGDAAREVAAS